MKHAIETLEEELKRLNIPSEEEEDYIDAIINFRQVSDIKLALKVLKEFKENSRLLNI